jgi:hypothetical protein
MKKIIQTSIIIITLFHFHIYTFAQSVGVGTNSPNPSAVLDVSSTNKGLLIPRVTSAQRNAITSPAKGLTVYDSTSGSFWYYDKHWKQVSITATSDSNLVTQQNPLSSFFMDNNFGIFDSSGYIYDSGGPLGNYGNNDAFNRVIFFPNGSLNCRLQLINLITESPYDSLRISQGSVNYTFYGNLTNQVLNFPAAGGSVILTFISNAVNTQPGFEIRFDHYFVPQTSSLNNLSSSLTGFYYIPEKVAVRGGYQYQNNWHRDSVGLYSLAYGYANQAKGKSSVALGTSSNASGESSLALGYLTTASGNNSTALGFNTTASGVYSTAMGNNTKASGFYSTAMGAQTTASEFHSTAMGFSTNASGLYSTAMGFVTTASGLSSTTTGRYTAASGIASTVMGESTKAKSDYSLVIGKYNDTTANNSLFEIGNGTANNDRKNAMTVIQNGFVGVGTVNPITNLHIKSFNNNPLLIDGSNDLYVTLAENGIRRGYIGSFAGNPEDVDIGTYASTLGSLHLTTNNLPRLTVINNGNVGIGTNSPAAKLHVADSAVVFTSSASNLNSLSNPPVQGSGVRLMWFPQRAAFRAGMIDNGTFYGAPGAFPTTQWNTDSIGYFSFATGINTKAKGTYAAAMGELTSANAEGSFATGSRSTADGVMSTALGYGVITKARASIAVGEWNDNTDNPPYGFGYTETDRIFQIGNGSSNGTRSNAITVLRNSNTGIGNINPAFPLDVTGQLRIRYKAGNNAGIWFNTSDNLIVNAYVGMHSDNFLGLWARNNPGNGGWGLLMNNTNGNIGIGTSTPNAPLQFANTGVNRKIVLYDANNNDHQYYGLGINTSTLRYQIAEVGASHKFYAGTSSTTSDLLFEVNGLGNAWLKGTLVQASDARLKTNMHHIGNPLQQLQQLNGYTYYWKDNKNPDEQIGLLAQEIQKVYPQLVKENDKGTLSVNYMGMVPVLLEAIKELNNQNNKQQQQIEKQNIRIAQLEQRLNQ